MKKIYGVLIFILLAVFAFTVSGCGGSSKSIIGNTDTETETVKQVAVLTSPAFEIGKDYQIYKGSSLTGMNGAQYYIADTGSESNKATLNLGFVNEINETLVFTNNGSVVFAYDPSGTENSVLTEGTVTRTGGNLLSYNGLTIASPVSFTALDIDRTNVKTIVLNGNSATYEGSAVPEYNYVWHSDPDHEDEYYTDGIDGIIEYTEDEILEKVSGDEVYIAHDIVYMPSGLEYTATVKNDDETEYAAYYSSSVQSSVAAKLGTGFEGPFIFATLPATMGGTPGGTPGGDMGPGGGDGGTPPEKPSDDMRPGDGNTPPNMRASSYNDQIASTIASMTHSSADAYVNPVLHITQPGTYSLQGTWNGQIWIDAGDDADKSAKVAVILNGVTVTCTVAPAIVFHDVYECGPDDETTAANTSMDIGKDLLDNAGAMVVIADGTTNNFTGANVYRMLKPAKKKDSVTTIDGTDVSQQKKRYKMDGAFYSFSSMAIGGESNATGVLNINSSTYEGLNTEMHATVESGTVNITAPDDAINVNEDDVSVFTMLDGNMTIKSTNGDGIDSNGYVVLLGGSLDITAGNQSTAAAGEGGIDAECGIYIDSSVNYTHHSTSGGGGDFTPPDGGNNSGDITPPDGRPDSGDIPVPPTSPDVPSPTPTPTPSSPDVPSPTPTPTPTPSSPDVPSPTPTPTPESPDVPSPTP
ncbi:MAG: carbohydrate-binding domain-containing protein, partial [Synergistaceae bacterium]|nr:carbohydrate-binding domain-containing protein [Synergistaceae bacterium]